MGESTKRAIGIFAPLAILVDGSRLAVTPPPQQAIKPSTAREHVPAERKVADLSCPEFSDRKNAKHPHSRGEIAALVDRCLHRFPEAANAKAKALPDGIHLLVASVPDLLHTLNLSFDRALEAVQQAAQDEGYAYDSAWLAWEGQAPQYSSRADKMDEEKDTVSRERCPGLILFRQSIQPPAAQDYDGPYAQGLFLFLVADRPTIGIDRIQWNNAIDWVGQHSNQETLRGALRVLGPTFSGSVPSMARAAHFQEG
jgi:hypothetical protein